MVKSHALQFAPGEAGEIAIRAQVGLLHEIVRILGPSR